jgi:hypothetical protein
VVDEWILYGTHFLLSSFLVAGSAINEVELERDACWRILAASFNDLAIGHTHYVAI